MLQAPPALNSAELDVVHGAMLRGELSSYSSTYLLHKELVRLEAAFAEPAHEQRSFTVKCNQVRQEVVTCSTSNQDITGIFTNGPPKGDRCEGFPIKEIVDFP